MKTRAFFITLIALACASCGQNGSKNDKEDQTPQKSTLTVQTKTCRVPYEFPAQLRGKRDVAIIPQVSGALEKVLVTEGQTVREGQLMFVINGTSYQAAVDNATASVKVAETNVESHKIELNATKQLYDKGIVAESQYQMHANALAVAKARLDEAKAVLKNARNELSHTRICSPSEGVVGSIKYRQGSLVGPSIPEPITIVSDNSTIYAYISINALDYMEMVGEAGSKEKLMEALPEAELLLGNDIVYPEKGKVETMSGIIDESTGAFSVRIAFPNPDGALAAGGSGTIRMTWDVDGIVIPRTAAYEMQDKYFVYKTVQEADSTWTAKSAIVKVARLNDSEYIVLEGLSDGETIVTEGVNKMNDGMKITPKE